MKKIICLAAVISIAASVWGCAKKSGGIVARVDGDVITLAEFNKRIERLPKHYQEMLKGQKRKFLDELINEKLLYKEALNSGIDNDPETREVIAEAGKKIIISRLLQQKIDEKLSLTQDNVRNYYDSHSEEFMLPERWRASHIVVDTPEEAAEIKKELDQGADFEELAQERSKDATAKRGGDVGFFSKGQLIPEFENACFGLKVNEISDVVKTQFGYHVIKLTDKKSPEVQEFAAVKDMIKKELERAQKKELLEGLMAQLKDNAKITVNEELISEDEKEGAPESDVPKEGAEQQS